MIMALISQIRIVGRALLPGFARTGRSAHPTVVAIFLLLLMVAPVYGRWSPQPLPSLVGKGDIRIWDEQYLGGRPPKGGKAAGGFLEVFGRFDPIHNEFRSGRFGLFSGSRVHTTWRFIKPLTDVIFAEGKTTIFDNHVSELVTPPFEVKLDYVTFLLSGGNMPNEACINLLIDGKVVRTATGRNDDKLEWVAFDVKAFRGKKAQIQVLDTSTAAFGYITFDCICQSPNSKGAVRIIAKLPSKAKTAARAQTISGRLAGTPAIANGQLKIGGKPVALKDLLLFDAGIKSAGDISGKRLQLINGDVLRADILKLEEDKLVIRHAMFDEMRIPVSQVARAVFQAGPSIKAEPGTLIHAKGSKIPGKLMWIRENNIAIKSPLLGSVPLPRARVRAYVFNRVKPGATDTVMLADGGKLSGKLTLDKDNLVIAHDVFGPVKLAVTDITRITRSLSGVTRLTDLKGEVRQQVGPIPPPAPSRVKGQAGDILRMFPHTVIRYKLPQSAHSRRLRATLAPVANSRTPMTTQVRTKDKKWTYTIDPKSTGVDIDIDLGKSGEIEITTDCPKAISYPCGIEWRNGLITKGANP